jgi:hypothetical protein
MTTPAGGPNVARIRARICDAGRRAPCGLEPRWVGLPTTFRALSMNGLLMAGSASSPRESK